MNDKQFGIGLKISIIITCIILIMEIALVVIVLKNNNNSSSILEDVEGATSEVQIENDEEFKQYLEIFGLMVQEETPLSSPEIETIIGFLSQISLYEPIQIAENQFWGFEEEIVKKVAVELLGKSEIPTGDDFVFDENAKAYRTSDGREFIFGKCMKVDKVDIDGNIYTVEYTCTFPNDGEIFEYTEGNKVSLNTYKIKAVIQKNETYEYSKYYLKNIELLSKDIVQYN